MNNEIQAILERENIIPKTIPNTKTNNDPNTEEDVVLSAINSIKQQNKENKALEETLTKLTVKSFIFYRNVFRITEFVYLLILLGCI